MRPASSSWSMAGGRRVLNIDYSSPIPAGLLHCKLDQGGATKQKGKKTTMLYPINGEHGSSSSSSFACMYNNDERQKQLMEEELESLEELGEYEREKEEEGDQGIMGRRRRRMMMVIMPMNERGEEEEEDEEEEEEGLKGVSKKRRLSGDQVRWLEQSFERESKLEVQRKEELARELGLRPRQVAVWFQNRRARCKTKRVEKEYNSLKHQYDSVLQERNRLQGEVSRLKELLGFHDEGMQGKGGDSSSHAKIIALGGLGNNSIDNGKEEEEEEQKGGGGGGEENKYRAMEVVEARQQREGNTNNSSCISTEQSEVVDTESSLENALIDPQKVKQNQSPGPPPHDCMQFNLPPYCTSVVKLEDCYITENWHTTSSYLFNLDDHTLFEDWHNVDSSTHSKPLWNPYL